MSLLYSIILSVDISYLEILELERKFLKDLIKVEPTRVVALNTTF